MERFLSPRRPREEAVKQWQTIQVLEEITFGKKSFFRTRVNSKLSNQGIASEVIEISRRAYGFVKIDSRDPETEDANPKINYIDARFFTMEETLRFPPKFERSLKKKEYLSLMYAMSEYMTMLAVSECKNENEIKKPRGIIRRRDGLFTVLKNGDRIISTTQKN